MRLIYQEPNTNGLFRMRNGDETLKGDGIIAGGTINTIVCNRNRDQVVNIDEVDYIFPENAVLPLVANQHFLFERPDDLIAWQFNRDFYCVADHDSEVGCVGFLFFGIRNPLFIKLSQQELDGIGLIEKLCIEEMAIKDRMQGEMLRTVLKRLIISITRTAKKQMGNDPGIVEEKLDLVRMFNILLETHFRSQHEVQFYANALHKSPKTLSNHFALLNCPSPSRLIQQRIVQEAKRYLFYTDKTAKEIAYSLGFTSPAHFSRYFKKQTSSNISAYKKAQV